MRGAVERFTPEFLGNGYVHLVACWIQALYPDRQIRFLNAGVSGNTVLDLASRWETDVLGQKPDWISVMIGINDVWRQFDSPGMVQNHVSIGKFGRTYRRILSEIRPEYKGLIIASPFFIEPNREDPMREMMDGYGSLAEQIAKEFDAYFINTQAVFDDYLSKAHSMTLASDRVHPNLVGHTLIAREFLKTLEAFPYSVR